MKEKFLKTGKKHLFIVALSSVFTGIFGVYINGNASYIKAMDNVKAIEVISGDIFLNDTSNDILDEAYEAVMTEEEYIVDLICSEGVETERGEWEKNLNFLRENYESIKQLENINMFYVDDYIEAYESLLRIESGENLQLKTNQARASSLPYQRGTAVQYALDYAKSFNAAYPNWSSYGGDCANFVSQCLYAGGKKMVTGGAATDYNYWFSSGNTCDVNRVSSTWRGAAAFCEFWKANAYTYRQFDSASSLAAFQFAQVGDPVSYLLDTGRAYHTLIVTSKSNLKINVTAHSTGREPDSPATSMPCVIYNVQKYSYK